MHPQTSKTIEKWLTSNDFNLTLHLTPQIESTKMKTHLINEI